MLLLRSPRSARMLRASLQWAAASSGATRGLSSEPVLSSRDAHSLWAALDDHQDAQRVMLGRILSELEKVATGAESSDNAAVLSAPVCDDESLLRFSVADLTPGTTKDHVMALLQGSSKLAARTMVGILVAATEIVAREATVLDLSAGPLTSDPTGACLHVVGDLHGDAPSLLRVLELCGPPTARNVIVFNGDFVDRGESGMEVLASLALLKISHPNSVFLIRGNHEDSLLATVCERKPPLPAPPHAPRRPPHPASRGPPHPAPRRPPRPASRGPPHPTA